MILYYEEVSSEHLDREHKYGDETMQRKIQQDSYIIEMCQNISIHVVRDTPGNG